MSKILQFDHGALAALFFTFVGCGPSVSQQVHSSVAPSPYERSTTFCVVPFVDSKNHPVVAEGFEAVLFKPNMAGIVFKPNKTCDGPFLVTVRAVSVDPGSDAAHLATWMNANTGRRWRAVNQRDTMTVVEVVVTDIRHNQTVDDVFFTSRTKPAEASGDSMGVLDDAHAIGVKLVEYLAERVKQASAAR
jgi:hypothetical protein